MSFSSDVKNELARVEGLKPCCEKAELLGVLRMSGAIVLRDQLLKHYPHARVPDQPEFANARGMLKFAKHVVGGA